MPFAPLPDGQIHYRFDGQQDLPVLLLSHSLGADLSMWDAQVPAFTRHFRVLRYDSHGHGASTFVAGGYSMNSLGQSVVGLLDHLGIAAVSFCGLSVGGLIGQWLALNAANRVRKIVLCNTAARIGTADGWNARIDAINKDGLASLSTGILDRWFTPGFREREPRTVDRFRKILEATPAESYRSTCAARFPESALPRWSSRARRTRRRHQRAAGIWPIASLRQNTSNWIRRICRTWNCPFDFRKKF